MAFDIVKIAGIAFSNAGGEDSADESPAVPPECEALRPTKDPQYMKFTPLVMEWKEYDSKEGSFRHNIERYHTPVEIDCLRKVYAHPLEHNVRFFRESWGGKPIESFEEIVRDKRAFYVYDWLFGQLREPTPTLSWMLDEVAARSPGGDVEFGLVNWEKCPVSWAWHSAGGAEENGRVSFCDNVHNLSRHWFDPNYFDSNPGKTKVIGVGHPMESGTVLHELAHDLMDKIYGIKIKDPKSRTFSSTHDVKCLRQMKGGCPTTPELAWIEGFARGFKHAGDRSFEGGGFFFGNNSLFYGGDDWAAWPFEKKHSDEVFVAHIVANLVRGAVLDSDAKAQELRDLSRLDEIVTTMEAAGHQASLLEFLTDYVVLFPERRKLIEEILVAYSAAANTAEAAALLSGPDFFARYVQEMDGKTEWTFILEDAAAARAWKDLAARGVRTALLDGTIDLPTRLELLQQARDEIDKAR